MADKSTCSSASSCSRESCEGCPSAKGASGIEKEPMNAASNVKRVIGVESGDDDGFIEAVLGCEITPEEVRAFIEV